MKDADLKRNASGYYDETCYKAITAPPRTGEIWTDRSGKKHWLILKSRNAVCSVLLLNTAETENSIRVMGKVPMYTDPLMVGYAFTDYLTTFVKKVKAEEFINVQRKVGEALGVIDINLVAPVPHDHINALERRNAELLEERDRLLIERNEVQKEAASLRFDLDAKNMADKMVSDSIAEMEQEIFKLKFYKDMYMDLIDKLVSVRGGAVNE